MIFVTNDKKGFTFIELLIVVIIVAILTGVSAPKLKRAFDNLSLQNFVKDIYYLSCYLQARAISEGRTYCLNIDKDSGFLRPAYQEADTTLKEITGRFGKGLNVPEGVIITESPKGKESIFFYPDSSVDKVTLAFENKSKDTATLLLKGISGEIKMQ
ncbi:MAG: prepilin-type N-terminal cleavage/methylation domain-containing protein [Candidatus Omnitrophica bacterium]|nr:prepilin-type N-terminal cleavage/methylation domain-containing protein [Candidatus Omnitrophota bacterium]MDD5552677.1 prepilin-type N-terminal cleavage/methylation domain-containing protein [Candidatus Omnitrophota bacterium]